MRRDWDPAGFVLRPGVTNRVYWRPKRPSLEHWWPIRRSILERDDWTCRGCGHRWTRGMQVHHLTDSGDHRPENLMTL